MTMMIIPTYKSAKAQVAPVHMNGWRLTENICRVKASFAREYWLRNVAALAYSFAPQGHFLGLETGTYGTTFTP